MLPVESLHVNQVQNIDTVFKTAKTLNDVY